MLELAAAAVRAQVPLWVIGKPYSGDDPYALQFVEFARQHSGLIRYGGPIYDRNRLAEIYRGARGFVLLSRWESLSLSALEAAACGCPLLLSDLPWARSTFGQEASYCPVGGVKETSKVLRQFYEGAPRAKIPPRPLSWIEVAQKLKSIYEEVWASERPKTSS